LIPQGDEGSILLQWISRDKGRRYSISWFSYDGEMTRDPIGNDPYWPEREKGHAERAITALQDEMTLAKYSLLKLIDEYYPVSI
jgi:hypothetical protein